MSFGMKIGHLAKVAHCTVETVRYYEREGLLPASTRSSGNFRLYGPKHVEALRFLRHCRSLDMTHGEMRALLAFRNTPDENCGEVNKVLDEHIGHVAKRIRELRALERELKSLRSECQAVQAARDCGIMQTLSRDAGQVVKTDTSHHKLHRTHG